MFRFRLHPRSPQRPWRPASCRSSMNSQTPPRPMSPPSSMRCWLRFPAPTPLAAHPVVVAAAVRPTPTLQAVIDKLNADGAKVDAALALPANAPAGEPAPAVEPAPRRAGCPQPSRLPPPTRPPRRRNPDARRPHRRPLGRIQTASCTRRHRRARPSTPTASGGWPVSRSICISRKSSASSGHAGWNDGGETQARQVRAGEGASSPLRRARRQAVQGPLRRQVHRGRLSGGRLSSPYRLHVEDGRRGIRRGVRRRHRGRCRRPRGRGAAPRPARACSSRCISRAARSARSAATPTGC